MAEEILDTAGAVQGPAQNRGEGKQGQGHGHEEGRELAAEYRGQGGGDDFAAGPGAELNAHAAANDGQGRQGADDDGVHKDLEDAVQALVHGALGVRRRVGDGCGAQARLVGEGAAP